MIQGILFDLDGTLVNTLEDIADAMNRALAMHGLDTYPLERYRYLVGNGAVILSQRAVGDRQEMAEAVRKTYQAWYETHNLVKSRPYPGIEKTLKALKDRGQKLMVLSNKPDADTRHVIAHYFGEDLFDTVHGQRPGVPIKPDPAAALEMARGEGLKPEEILYLGDTSVDIACARRAGMHAVGVLWGFRDRQELTEAGAEHILEKPEDVLDLAAQKTGKREEI